jgi:hypothetical protein
MDRTKRKRMGGEMDDADRISTQLTCFCYAVTAIKRSRK